MTGNTEMEQEMKDPIFEEEQAHLHTTYRTLCEMKTDLEDKLQKLEQQAADEKNDIRDNLRLDTADDEVLMESYAEMGTWNRYVDSMNVTSDLLTHRLKNLDVLLKAPYFARVTLQFSPEEEAEDYYIGSAAVSKNSVDPLIIDWRSPIAETYYNQENGKTSYEVNGRRIEADLLLRRQFDLRQDQLNAYFDTQIAIEDKLLLQSLSRHQTGKMKDITAQIQREQNAVIRHPDVPALLVNGIAGSGKTSILLQRIAYLFYRQRETLRPEQVCLLTLNPVFREYIDTVLPDLGESNPNTLTWAEFMDERHLPFHDGTHPKTSLSDLTGLEEALPSYTLGPEDFFPVYQKERLLLSVQKIAETAEGFRHFGTGVRLINVLSLELENEIKRMIRGGNTKADSSADGEDEAEDNDEEAADPFQIPLDHANENRLQNDNGGALKTLRTCAFLNYRHIAEKLLYRSNVTALELLYLRMLLTGESDKNTKYVMIDEVQDYTAAQLRLLLRFFPKAKFMLLGDEFQAIREDTATFAQIRDLFLEANKKVTELNLFTCYRSTPEITTLFTSLLPKELRVHAASVQREGTPCEIISCSSYEEQNQALLAAISRIDCEHGLTAVICKNHRSLQHMSEILPEIPMIEGSGKLPDHGIFLIELSYVKGLEFDHVILPDLTLPLKFSADQTRFEEVDKMDLLVRHRLYTTVSRATQKLVMLCLQVSP